MFSKQFFSVFQISIKMFQKNLYWDQIGTKINKVMNFGDSSHKTVEMPDCVKLFRPKRASLSRNTFRFTLFWNLVFDFRGSPQPKIMWKREDGDFIRYDGGSVSSVDGNSLIFAITSRAQVGEYLCIASNGVPPSISKRIVLRVQCKFIIIK